MLASSHFPSRADEIARQWNDPDIREICEHYELICRDRDRATGSAMDRLSDLKVALKDELFDLLLRNNEHSNNTSKG